MNDLIVNEIYNIKDNKELIKDYINKLISKENIFDSFVQSRQHLFEIYNDRLDFSIYKGNHFEGLEEVVEEMRYSGLKNIRLSYIDGTKRSCSIFSSDDYKVILGIIFYNN
ncbi:hypothetical protein LF887_04175 [Chryseobacterium sp. MEBOG06]|uniref:hypothetical protein n=1 Tax=Chryseobacterium sp. MEBOG06 TaxID=2879938 RepID=UPI001F25689C|nr:hypothetical protein [Chryseobacterium sp. MEBOG06]UKB84842.1 hypothetical protein LF887_04175 [Chryseobacterium sp. MEBOG06]